MKLHRLPFLSLGLVLPAGLLAQSGIPLQLALRESKWTVTAGLRASSGGGEVSFGNLGGVPASRTVDPLGQTSAGRNYDNGTVITDAPRLNERAGGVQDGEVISTPGGRYEVTATNSDGDTIVVGDYLSYTPGRTRTWGYASADQVTSDGRIGMNLFSSTSEGATAEADGDAAGGVELGLARRLGRFANGRVEWGIGALVGLTDINSKSRGTVTATLNTLTDYYSLNGQTAPNAPYSGPTFADLLDSDGNLVSPSGRETTTTIGDTPVARTETSVAGAATVDGYWQIKGAYYLIRVGPQVRARITDRFALNVSAGFAGAYVGTTYRVEEILRTPNPDISITADEERDQSEFNTGFYGELSAEYWLTPRTGFFAGATYHSLGSYEQAINGRTATIDLGKGAGFRLGIITRF
jgi:hypothetical protein